MDNMLQQRQIVIQALGKQIEYLVCAKDSITSFHSISGCLCLSMLPYTGLSYNKHHVYDGSNMKEQHLNYEH
jgi:hypothetical protein